MIEGELSELDEMFLDSSSADIDIPLNLSWRRKYGRNYGICHEIHKKVRLIQHGGVKRVKELV